MNSISIPAPARGRTNTKGFCTLTIVISIPAPARGRTAQNPDNAVRQNFNSRPREGANLGKIQAIINGLTISIPAPARGRTLSATLRTCTERISIPAPARGRTQADVAARRAVIFQFPPPRGGEHVSHLLSAHGEISIPAPARGRTENLQGGTKMKNISIPAPARGRT